MRSALAKVDGIYIKEVAMPDKAVIAVERDKVSDEQILAAVKSAGSRYSATIE